MNGHEEKALSIIGILRSKGYKAYLCGGCVRDFLLGYPPKDYDIVTDAAPDDVQTLFKRTIHVGMQFGIIRVILGQDVFEVATFREDGSYTDGRRPESVHFSDEKTDALRRDFTVNGMFLDPETKQVIDYVGGEQDLRNRLIRTIGEPVDRFSEDHLRLLRAARFACQLDFAIDANTWTTMAKMAYLIKKISAERIRDEVLKMLRGPAPARAVLLLEESGLLSHILPEVAGLKDVRYPTGGKNFFDQTVSLLQHGCPFDSDEMALGALLYHIGQTVNDPQHRSPTTKMLAGAIGERLRLPARATEKLVNLVIWNKEFAEVPQLGISELKRFLRLPFFQEVAQLYRIDCLSNQRDLATYEYCQQKLAELRPELYPSPLLTGNDLIRLGFEPGPIFKQILDFLEEQQLAGKINGQEEAVSLVMQIFAKE
jgi:poly(A) polymerase